MGRSASSTRRASFAHSRRLAFENVQLDADVDPHKLSHFVGGLTVLEDGGKFPVLRSPARSTKGAATKTRASPPRRSRSRRCSTMPSTHRRCTSRTACSTTSTRASTACATRRGAMRRHVSIAAKLDHFQPYLNGIAKPLRDGRGYLASLRSRSRDPQGRRFDRRRAAPHRGRNLRPRANRWCISASRDAAICAG